MVASKRTLRWKVGGLCCAIMLVNGMSILLLGVASVPLALATCLATLSRWLSGVLDRLDHTRH